MTGAEAATQEYSAGDDAVFTIAQRDLVFRLKPDANAMIGRSDGSGIMDMKLKVFSNVNNFPLRLIDSAARKDPTLRMMAIRKSIAFVGVALQPIDYSNKNSKDMVAVQVAGSITIQNTGPYAIRPGQRVAWDVPAITMVNNGRVSLKRPRSNARGQPPQKDLIHTIPYDELVANTVGDVTSNAVKPDSDIVTQMHAAHEHVNGPATNNAIGKILNEAYNQIGNGTPADRQKAAILYGRMVAAYVAEANNRVIGIALSGASPGQQFGAYMLPVLVKL